MRDWEFLLQKEGDRAWLPLESPTVEILEGRYRVVAQSRRQNSTVEIRIVHQPIEDQPSRRRLQSRSAQTSDRGLVVVMPYTHLQPGLWELRAQGDLMADMLGESWQAIVQLHVCPQEIEWEWPEARPPEAAKPIALAEAVEPVAVPSPLPQAKSAVAVALQTEQPPAVELTQSPQVSDSSAMPAAQSEAQPAADFDLVRVEAMFAQVERSQQDLDAAAKASLDELGKSAPLACEPIPEDTASPDDLRLVLQTSFVVQQGELLRLQGRIESPSAQVNTSGLVMKVRLRDPQRSQVLAEVRESLPRQALPLPFECAIEIPNGDQTHLLLGELTITADGAIVIQQAFTVTIALERLLTTLLHPSEAEWLQPPLQFAESAPPDLNLALLNLVGAPQPQLQHQPAASAPLPPQLLKPESTRTPKPLQLPFAVSESRQNAAQPVQPEAVEVGFAERTSTPPDSIAPSPAPTEPLAAQAEAIDLSADLPMDLLMPSDPLRPRRAEGSSSIAPATPEDAAFRSLNLQQRFWSRLNSLATDEELSGWLGDAAPLSGSNHAALPEVDTRAAQEFVVEDEYPTRSRAPQPLEPPESMVLPSEEPIPTPQLEVPQGELTAGSAIPLRVKLPNLTPRIYVKLWLRDAQSRSLLEGPRWLTDFIPDGRGSLEARSSIAIPYGCVELQIEAIAVEMATQRESHKATVFRSVMPPDLSVMLELDF